MRNLGVKSLTLFLSFLILGTICRFAKAETIFIRDKLSGNMRFSGFPISNPDGSTTFRGLAYRGDVIEGNLPGEWASVMRATYLQDESTGTVEGYLAVGVRKQTVVYGYVTGDIDPIAGNFSFIIVIVGGTGQYEGFIGAGDFSGALSDEGKNIEGDLILVLSDSESGQLREETQRRR